MKMMFHYIGERLELEGWVDGEYGRLHEKSGRGMTAEVLMATPRWYYYSWLRQGKVGMANLSKASNIVQEEYVLYDVTSLLKSGIRFLSQPTVSTEIARYASN